MTLDNPGWLREVQSADEFLSLIDAEDRLMFVNHAATQEINGVSVYDFIAAEFRDLAQRSIDAARSTGYPQHYESEASSPDGGSSHYSNWIFPVSSSDTDGVLAFVATDITALRRMESELERVDVTFRSLVDQAPDHIVIADTERRISFVNRFEFGLQKSDVIGRPIETFVPPEDQDRVASEIDAVIETGQRRSYETTVNMPTGDHVFATRAGPIIVEGRVEGVVTISTEISDRLELERERERLNTQLQQSQKMEALGQLTGGVAHDFNNLLTAIAGNLELVQHDLTAGTSSSTRLAEAMRAVDQAADLTRRLLVFARNQPLDPHPERIDHLLGEMAPLLERTLGETIEVRMTTPEPLWRCDIDPGQFEQAILNLAVNARDAMPSGGNLEIVGENLVVDDRQQGSSSTNEWVVLTVRDTGSGMDADLVDHAFEPFFTTKAPGRGTGLGLSMVHGFVSQSGGLISLTSQSGVGTAVRIELPRSHDVGPTPAPDEPSLLPRGAGDVILVVEDQPLVREACLLVLEQLGYVGLETSDAAEAVAALAGRDDIAVVLSDFGLPGEMNGIDLAHHVAELDTPLPMILMSGYADPAVTGGELPSGVRFLQKPFKQTELAAALASALEKPRSDQS